MDTELSMLMAVKLFVTVLHCIELIVPVIRHKRTCDIANAICACTCVFLHDPVLAM
jgi:hypothetical protein